MYSMLAAGRCFRQTLARWSGKSGFSRMPRIPTRVSWGWNSQPGHRKDLESFGPARVQGILRNELGVGGYSAIARYDAVRRSGGVRAQIRSQPRHRNLPPHLLRRNIPRVSRQWPLQPQLQVALRRSLLAHALDEVAQLARIAQAPALVG